MKKYTYKIKNLRKLQKYSTFSDEDLIKVIKEQEKNNNLTEEVESMFIDETERKAGIDLLEKYLDEYSIETISDKNLLKQLIHLEVFHNRLQKLINEFNSANGAAPYQLMDMTHKNLDKIISIKEKLGLLGKKNEAGNDALKALELLKKKFKAWQLENQASRYASCPHCGKAILWMIKPEYMELRKHPFFKDRLLGNQHLIDLYKKGILNKLDISLILGTSEDYIDTLIEKWNSN